MMLTLICVKCRTTDKGNASSGAVLASKKGWTIQDGLMLCPKCGGGKPKKGKKRQNSKNATFDGYTFQSGTEMNYYIRLKKRQQAGEIGEIEVHPPFTLHPAFSDKYGRNWRAVVIKFDFQYTDLKTGQVIVDDVKAPDPREPEKAIHQERAQVLLPLVQALYPDYQFRWCDEFGVAFKTSGTLKKLPKGTGQKKLL